MDCFIKKVFCKNVDENCHRQFVRFSKGDFAGRALINLNKTDKLKVTGSSEWINDFVSLASEIGEVKFSGIVLSKEDLGLPGKKKAGLIEYHFNGNSEDVKKIANKAYTMMLDGEGQGISLKIKKKLPKPGKGEGKINDKFCSLEADLKYWNAIKNAFFWDVPDCKKAKIGHEYIITEMVLPKGEKDFEKIRVLAKRKGKLVRKLAIDGNETSKETEMEV